jgi:hypothetical protein
MAIHFVAWENIIDKGRKNNNSQTIVESHYNAQNRTKMNDKHRFIPKSTHHLYKQKTPRV